MSTAAGPSSIEFISTPAFPAYIEKFWTARKLAYYHDGMQAIIIENEQVPYYVDNLSTLLDLLFRKNLLLYVPQLVTFPLLEELVYLENCNVNCDVDGHPCACRIKYGNRGTRWIVPADSWGMPCKMELLQTLRKIFRTCKVGTPPTPSALGQALMRLTYKEQYGNDWKAHRHHRPNLVCCSDILTNMTGGRVDTPGLGNFYEILTTWDEKNAYAFHYKKHPAKAAVTIGRNTPLDRYTTWFALCTVTVPASLISGPFPVRLESGKGKSFPMYPTEPGEYQTWIWREQAEDCIMLGCSVEIVKGWAWRCFTTDNAAWVRKVEELRDVCPDQFKLCIVGGIGRHGSKETSYQLIPPDKAQPWDMMICDNELGKLGKGLLYNCYIHEEINLRYNAQPHWFAYTIMMCARDIFWKAYPWKEKEMLVMVDYDCIYVKGYHEDDTPLVGTPEAKRLPSGSFKRDYHHNATIAAPRAINSDEVTKRPGVKRNK